MSGPDGRTIRESARAPLSRSVYNVGSLTEGRPKVRITRRLALASLCTLGIACGGKTERAQPPPKAQSPGDTKPNAKPGTELELVYDVDLDKAVDDKAVELRRDLEAELVDAKVAGSVKLSAAHLGAVTLEVADRAARAKVAAYVARTYRETAAARPCDASDGPNAICVEITAAYAGAVRKAALGQAIQTIRQRFEAGHFENAKVVARGEQIVIDLPGLDPEQVDAAKSLVARGGKLELLVVDDGSAYMRQLFAHVGADGAAGVPTDAAARTAGIRADVDMWRTGDGSPQHVDYYLVASDREEMVTVAEARRLGCWIPTSAEHDGNVRCTTTGRSRIERYVSELARQDPKFELPRDRQLAFERISPDPSSKDQRPRWRSYYVERVAALTGNDVENATAALDPTNRWGVLLDFNRKGARALADLTARIVGKKLAIVLDGVIASAPIITGPINGGRAAIAMGGSDPAAQKRDATELATVLETGSLPAPLREASSQMK